MEKFQVQQLITELQNSRIYKAWSYRLQWSSGSTNMDHYNWTGLLWTMKSNNWRLVPTQAYGPHCYSLWQRYCGQVAVSGKPSKYLMCMLKTITYPATLQRKVRSSSRFTKMKVDWPIDIDSHELDLHREDHLHRSSGRFRYAPLSASSLHSNTSTGSNLEAIHAGINPESRPMVPLSPKPTMMFWVLKKISKSRALAAANAPNHTKKVLPHLPRDRARYFRLELDQYYEILLPKPLNTDLVGSLAYTYKHDVGNTKPPQGSRTPQ